MESMFISGHPEQRRLNVLADLHIMDSSPEASFDNIVNIASQGK